jgi:hypothetical protein
MRHPDNNGRNHGTTIITHKADSSRYKEEPKSEYKDTAGIVTRERISNYLTRCNVKFLEHEVDEWAKTLCNENADSAKKWLNHNVVRPRKKKNRFGR